MFRNDALIDETGNQYGKLKIIKRIKVNKKKNDRLVRWLCFCKCGKEKIVSGKDLRSGIFTTCGYCSWIKSSIRGKGNSSHPLFNTWHGILTRCYNTENPSFKYYGEIGIQVYYKWHDSKCFYEWMDLNLGPRPEGYSLDRINVYENYEPGNLRWADNVTQMNNRRLVLLSEKEHGLVMKFRLRRSKSSAEKLRIGA